jgi:hypothetical protein
MRRSISPILLKFRETYPRQTALELARCTGASPRHCERALSGRGKLGEKFLIALLRSKDFGEAAYDAAMEGCSQPWYVQKKKKIELSELWQTVADTKRQIEKKLEAAE